MKMKLKCELHERRVMILNGGAKIIHRSDGTECCEPVVMGSERLDRLGYLFNTEMAEFPSMRVTRNSPVWSPEMQLLNDIFVEDPMQEDVYGDNPLSRPPSRD